GVYRFWRDFGFAAGALLAGFAADAIGFDGAIGLVTALTGASGVWVALTSWTESDRTLRLRVARRSVEELLVDARRRIEPRLEPSEVLPLVREGALLLDLRSTDERRTEGIVPGSIHIPRSVLEWRADPDSPHHNPAIADLRQRLIAMCADGYSSSFAAAVLRELGFAEATDMVGGFRACGGLGRLSRRPGRSRSRPLDLLTHPYPSDREETMIRRPLTTFLTSSLTSLLLALAVGASPASASPSSVPPNFDATRCTETKP